MYEAFYDIGMKDINVVIKMECDGEASCNFFLGEVCPTQRVSKWLDWLTNSSSGEEVHNIDWLIAVFSVTKKNDRRPDPGSNS